ncbi:hypothetical protein M3Y99_00635100 [Aphelenchoides fujianensis]|nr:hypothetical protein M3Y99_01581500 [Aphelenchoides fujianensis]KAI6239028.1 hypothetical protein M3Y99_00635100 [Aphelenchoides fujianensis]
MHRSSSSVAKAEKFVSAGVEQAAKSYVDVLKMQDLARAAIRFGSRLLSGRPAAPANAEERKNDKVVEDAASTVAAEVERAKAVVFDLSPLPADFDFSYALISYMWTVVIMTAKTLGHRVARFAAVESILSELFYGPLVAVLLYVLLPVYTHLINVKYPEKQLGLLERRAVIIGLAFVYGLLSEHLWLHWVHGSTAPYYFYPAIIGATLQLLGPPLRDNRPLLLGCCVGAAVVVSVGVAHSVGVLSVGYVGATILSALSSLLNLQLLIGDLRKNGSDERMMIAGHYRSVLVSVYSHVLLTLLFARYDSERVNQSNAAVE